MYILEVQSILLHVMHDPNVIILSTCTHIMCADYYPMYHNLEALTQQLHIPKLYCSPQCLHTSLLTLHVTIYIADHLYDLSQSMHYCGVRR